MASYTAITDTTETLLTVLRDEIEQREDIDAITADDIVLASPDDLSTESDVRLSVFPYKFTRESKGRPGRVQTGANTFQSPPLVLNVFYLVTAYPATTDHRATERQEQQSALGLAMQVFHDNSSPDQPIGSVSNSDSFQITIHADDNDEIERVWSTFVDSSIQPSVIYEAGPVMIESTQEEEVTRVSERDVDVDRKSK